MLSSVEHRKKVTRGKQSFLKKGGKSSYRLALDVETGFIKCRRQIEGGMKNL